MLLEKAKDSGKILKVDFDLSMSLVPRWRNCNLMACKCKRCEKQDHDSKASENWIMSMWPKTCEHYFASEIYSCD